MRRSRAAVWLRVHHALAFHPCASVIAFSLGQSDASDSPAFSAWALSSARASGKLGPARKIAQATTDQARRLLDSRNRLAENDII